MKMVEICKKRQITRGGMNVKRFNMRRLLALVMAAAMVFSYLPGKLCRHFCAAGKNHKAGHHPIQTVHRPHIGVLIPECLSDKLRHAARFVR